MRPGLIGAGVTTMMDGDEEAEEGEAEVSALGELLVGRAEAAEALPPGRREGDGRESLPEVVGVVNVVAARSLTGKMYPAAAPPPLAAPVPTLPNPNVVPYAGGEKGGA